MNRKSLIRDRLFTTRTDHRNILFIKETYSPVTVRWHWKELNLDCNKSSLKTIINITENSRYEIVQCTTSSRTRALQQYVDRVYI